MNNSNKRIGGFNHMGIIRMTGFFPLNEIVAVIKKVVGAYFTATHQIT